VLKEAPPPTPSLVQFGGAREKKRSQELVGISGD
jgi:hypothetical protein